MEEIKTVLEKYNNFKDAQIRSVDHVSETSKIVNIGIDDDYGQEIASVKIIFNNVTKSKILQNSVLAFLDMMSGISIVHENGLYGFALGNDSAMLHVHLAPMYIIASEVSIEEN